MKKRLALCLALTLLVGVLPAQAAETATPTASKVYVDGVDTTFDAYVINGNNYFKLRDIAQVLRGKPQQFNVGWNGNILLTSGEAYQSVGGELARGDGVAKSATSNTAPIYKDGTVVPMTAYTIGQNNYFKLRDIGEAFGFGVYWDSATATVHIDTLNATTSDGRALIRAKEYGFVSSALPINLDGQMTYGEFYTVLQAVVSKLDATKLSQLEDFYQSAIGSNQVMVKGDAMGPAYYAIALLGYGEYSDLTDASLPFYANMEQEYDFWPTLTAFQLFPKLSQPSPYQSDWAPFDYVAAGQRWCATTLSKVDLQPVLFEHHQALATPLSRFEGLVILTRLYETTLDVDAKLVHSEEVQAILDAAEDYKTAFATAKSDFEAEGKTYYVSNDGNDKNSGLNPESPWKSIDKAFGNTLQKGDAVLFERGGTWHPDEVILPVGIDIGAYGEGARPIFTGITATSDSLIDWTLYSEENGAKIWKYVDDVTDSNVLILNNGEEYVYKTLPYRTVDGYVNQDGTPFDLAPLLIDNLSFCTLPDLSGKPLDFTLHETKLYGPLYLRCDEGNPAEVFDAVEIPQLQTALTVNDDTHIYDIHFRGYTLTATSLTLYNKQIQPRGMYNCEVSWCGGMAVQTAPTEHPNMVLGSISGGAVQVSNSNVTVQDCYIHDCGPMAFITTIYAFGDILRPRYENQLFTGNLVERCGATFHWADLCKMRNPDGEGFLSNLVFSDNMVLYSGGGWLHPVTDNDHISPFISAVENEMGAVHNDGIYITDNVFFLAKGPLVQLNDKLWNSDVTVNQSPIFSGNTYVQHEYGLLAWWNGDKISLTDENVKSVLEDKSGKVIVVEYLDLEW